LIAPKMKVGVTCRRIGVYCDWHFIILRDLVVGYSPLTSLSGCRRNMFWVAGTGSLNLFTG
jgi:hypothetical protein